MGRTPLHIAAMNGFRTLCTYLLSKGSDPKIKDSFGCLPAEYMLSIQSNVVKNNISAVPISDRQLKTIYYHLAGEEDHLTAAKFIELWDSLDDMGVPKKVPTWIAKLPPDGKIGLQEFCIEALKTSAW